MGPCPRVRQTPEIRRMQELCRDTGLSRPARSPGSLAPIHLAMAAGSCRCGRPLFEPVRFDQPLQDEGISADSTLRLRGVTGIKRDQPSRPVFKRAAQVVSQPRTGRRPSLQAAAPIATDGLRRVDSNSSDQQRPAPAHNARTICRAQGWHSRKVVEAREMQINRLFCKPICKPDAAGQAETGETQKVREDFAEKID